MLNIEKSLIRIQIHSYPQNHAQKSYEQYKRDNTPYFDA